MKGHLRKSERVRLGGNFRTKSPKPKWAQGKKKADRTGKIS